MTRWCETENGSVEKCDQEYIVEKDGDGIPMKCWRMVDESLCRNLVCKTCGNTRYEQVNPDYARSCPDCGGEK